MPADLRYSSVATTRGLILFGQLSGAQAEFTDEMINPFLGPYKLEKSIVGTCPDSISMMAECTLDQLDLKSSKNLDFDFITFKGINSGEMKTTIKNKVVEKNVTSMKDLKIISRRSSYMKNYKTWFNETIELELGNKKISIKKSHLDKQNKNSTTSLHCEYVFDEIENKKILDEFNKSQTVK